MRYRGVCAGNISGATVMGVQALADFGETIVVRGFGIREIRNWTTVLSRPWERCLFLPGRNNDIFATLAEAIWVLAGRADVAWLSHYLPRAVEYADDGVVWRAGYGPRLFNWQGVDQVQEVIRLLEADGSTRRAACSLFDPSSDYGDSKDIPCNNWLHFLIRGGKLHLNVALRSNDAIWGFSGINAFEWSLLLDLVAMTLGVEVGELTMFASSFHIYERHYSLLREIPERFCGVTCYNSDIRASRPTSRYSSFKRQLPRWFTLENAVRDNPLSHINEKVDLEDGFLRAALDALRVRSAMKAGWDVGRIAGLLESREPNDLLAAVLVQYVRQNLIDAGRMGTGPLLSFLKRYHNQGGFAPQEWSETLEGIIQLHRRKDEAYGDSWKRRGELTSILANIARKVDRLANLQGKPLLSRGDESDLDTAIDLLVYLTKYKLFLVELAGDWRAREKLREDERHSSSQIAVETLLRQLSEPKRGAAPLAELIESITCRFEELHRICVRERPSPESRLQMVEGMLGLAQRLVEYLSQAGLTPGDQVIRHELGKWILNT